MLGRIFARGVDRARYAPKLDRPRGLRIHAVLAEASAIELAQGVKLSHPIHLWSWFGCAKDPELPGQKLNCCCMPCGHYMRLWKLSTS
jgi:hypothetical protein